MGGLPTVLRDGRRRPLYRVVVGGVRVWGRGAGGITPQREVFFRPVGVISAASPAAGRLDAVVSMPEGTDGWRIVGSVIHMEPLRCRCKPWNLSHTDKICFG